MHMSKRIDCGGFSTMWRVSKSEENSPMCRNAIALILMLCSGLSWAADADLVFTPEPGVRVEGGAIPEAGLDASGNTWLYYHGSGPERVAISADGLTFP